jgi:hypothetical protein
MSNHQRAVISNFLTTTLLMSGIIIMSGKMYIGVGMAILYSSLCSVLLLMSRMSGHRRTHIKYGAMLPPLFAGIALFFLSIYKLSGCCSVGMAPTSGHPDILGLILLVYLLCIIIISGIIFCSKMKKESSFK